MVTGDVLFEANETLTVTLTGVTSTFGPDPSFATQQTFATGVSPRSVAIGDVNGDGRPDLAVANTDSSTVSVLLNTTAIPTPARTTWPPRLPTCLPCCRLTTPERPWPARGRTESRSKNRA